MKKITRLITILFLFFFLNGLSAQMPYHPTSSELYESIQRLQVLGSALFVAAHPDDENTRLISWLANEKKVNIAYLSLTRGDGGQNLIGTEIEELLGVLRTQELLAARRLDGGSQFFSRANDFGFSKHPDETLRLWNKEEVLGDVVWTIRKWQPDIIINRFDAESAGKTHGHHTASAMLGVEAFELAGDNSAYPSQLEYVDAWNPKRLYFNTSWWFYGSRENFEKADKSDMAVVDIGTYFPLKGKSNTEIAAESRSQHRCQGMGNIGNRGSQTEYLKVLKGEVPENKNDLFAGIDITWNRVKGGKKIGDLLAETQKKFNFSAPWESVPKLIEAYRMIKNLPEGYWKDVKSEEIRKVIRGCLGLYTEVIAADWSATPGETIRLDLENIMRSPGNVKLQSVVVLPMGRDSFLKSQLVNNEVTSFSMNVEIPADIPFTNAYWLNKPWELGMYTVEDQMLRGLPETPRQLKVRWNLLVENEPFSFETDVVYKKEDPAKGEVYRPFEITPPVFANFSDKVVVFANNQAKPISVNLRAGKNNLKGSLRLKVPEGWKVEPESVPFDLLVKGQESNFVFSIYPPEGQSEGVISPEATVDGKAWDRELIIIDYDHIPAQTILRKSEAKVVKIDLKTAGTRVGYLMGAGDEIPASLQQIGYDVTILDEKDLTEDKLKTFDAVILGVRAYNTIERLKFANATLWKYVENGGTLITQYNTTRDLLTDKVGPYPLKISRDRVTVEEAEVRFLKPDHAVLNFPNKITQKDFKGWIQERGLYFPDEWDSHYEAILSSNDPGESPKDGGLLVAQYGEGYFIYTGYSWFRELPAGVPGAFRLFANMISIGESPKP